MIPPRDRSVPSGTTLIRVRPQADAKAPQAATTNNKPRIRVI